jgi:hypothetical protein
MLGLSGVAADFMPVQLSWSTSPGTQCVAFRQTGNCDPDGPLQPAGDRSCSETIPCSAGSCPSGYCECAGGVIRNKVTCKAGSHKAFSCADECAGVPVPPSKDTLALTNGFVSVHVDVTNPAIVFTSADFAGAGGYSSTNAFSTPFVLESVTRLGKVSRSDQSGVPAKLTVLSNTSTLASIRLDGIKDAAAGSAVATESWTLTLAKGARTFSLSTEGSTLSASSSSTLPSADATLAVRHAVGFAATSVYGLFDKGVVQVGTTCCHY